MKFCLDTPTETDISGIARFGGWCITDKTPPFENVHILADGRVLARGMQAKRPDVGAAFPDCPQAGDSGFVGDLVFPPNVAPNTKVYITIEVDGQTVYEKPFRVRAGCTAGPRTRSYDLLSLLDRAPSAIVAGAAQVYTDVVPCVRLLEPGHTHGYGPQSRALIDALAPGQLYLDFGAGIKRPEDLRPNAVLLDYIQFPNIDIASTTRDIPLRDESVDLVVSQAVLEHVPDPFYIARELYRVLKPGGSAVIDVPFMVPYHSDPDHYFNMTRSGLGQVMAPFDEVTIAIQPYQMPSWGLRMQLDAVVPTMAQGVWRSRLEELLAHMNADGDALDRDLGPTGRETIAAGFSALARKKQC